MEHQLAQDIRAYDEMLEELCKHHKGKHVLFYDGEFKGSFDTFDNAADFAIQNFGDGPYLIRFVGQSNQMSMPASVAFKPIADAHFTSTATNDSPAQRWPQPSFSSSSSSPSASLMHCWPRPITGGLGLRQASPPVHSPFDKFVHAGLFAICGALVVRGWLSESRRWLPLYLLFVRLCRCY